MWERMEVGRRREKGFAGLLLTGGWWWKWWRATVRINATSENADNHGRKGSLQTENCRERGIVWNTM